MQISLNKQLSAQLFPVNFACKSIINIILDYSEDCKLRYNQVMHEFKSFLRDVEYDYGYTDGKVEWLCYGININYSVFRSYEEFYYLRDMLDKFLLNKCFIYKLMILLKFDKKVKEYSKELRNKNIKATKDDKDDKEYYKEYYKKKFEKIFIQINKEYDEFLKKYHKKN